MKHTSLSRLAGAGLLALAIIQPGCTGDQARPEEAEMTATEMEEAAPSVPTSFLYVQHAVQDFDKWLVVYDGFDAERDSAGVAEIWVYRDVDRPEIVHVLHGANDVATLRAFTTMEALAAAMKEAGVVGKPRFDFMNLVVDTAPAAPISSQYSMLVKHEVADWNVWKSAFDSHADARAAAGLTSRGVARDADNPNVVYVNFAVSDLAAARAFAASDDLKTVMQAAGVMGVPEIYFAETVRGT